uniref:Calcium voltage-gated channel subunit alpha1 A n=1 Tax=Homo sapiens TaxID=9606 RepID=I3L2V5_HUMAN
MRYSFPLTVLEGEDPGISERGPWMLKSSWVPDSMLSRPSYYDALHNRSSGHAQRPAGHSASPAQHLLRGPPSEAAGRRGGSPRCHLGPPGPQNPQHPPGQEERMGPPS